MLHVTNGESVIHLMREAQLPGEYLSWIDVLHDGPVPNQPSDELARTRAAFISRLGWDSADSVQQGFARRDEVLAAHADDDEIVLWFEHDLFDQLQLIQILDRLNSADVSARLSIICIDRFAGVEHFIGLGQLTPAQLVSLAPTRTPITPAQLTLGRAAWDAFRAPAPTEVIRLLQRDVYALPFLGPALMRWLVEFPWTRHGLSLSEERLLRAAYRGPGTYRDLYLRARAWESAIFMGDSSAFWRIDRLSTSPYPALERSAETFSLTDFGRALLNGEADWIRDRGGIDTWLGGTHLFGPDARWRWDGKTIVEISGDR